MTEDRLLDLDGAVIAYLAANHASLVASYDEPDTAHAEQVMESIRELRDAAIAALDL